MPNVTDLALADFRVYRYPFRRTTCSWKSNHKDKCLQERLAFSPYNLETDRHSPVPGIRRPTRWSRSSLGAIRRMIMSKLMRKTFGALLLGCINASAALILTISDPNQTVTPGAHAVYHGTLINTDAVGYTIVAFGGVNPPTDATGPPFGPLFPIAQPAVPFDIAAGGQFIGVLWDITVPANAQIRSHNFGIQAASNTNQIDGQTIVSNFAFGNLTVVPEPGTGILACIGLTAFCFVGFLALARAQLATKD
jgi:hypothetical protein